MITAFGYAGISVGRSIVLPSGTTVISVMVGGILMGILIKISLENESI